MSDKPRCPECHPLTGKRCLSLAGHEGKHDPEGFTAAECEVIAKQTVSDLHALLEKWTAQRFPSTAMAVALVNIYMWLSSKMLDYTDGEILLNVMSCMAMKELTPLEAFQYLAKKLDIPATLIPIQRAAKGAPS